MTAHDRFTDWNQPGTVSVTKPVLCSICKHRTPGDGYPSCAAFDRIPVAILANRHGHWELYPGDGGIRVGERQHGDLAPGC